MKTFLLSLGGKYFRTTPNGRYARWDATKKTCKPMCEKCCNAWVAVLKNLNGINDDGGHQRRIKVEPNPKELKQCPECFRKEEV